MYKNLANGIDINVIPTKKFKTISIAFDLITESNPNDFAKRAILAELLEISNHDYPTQSDLARHLSSMYGASFGTNILRYGNLSILRINLSLPNPKYLNVHEDLLKQACDFLYSVVYKPLVTNLSFDKATFALQKQNMEQYVQSISDDKQYYASLKLKEMYFKDYPNRGNFMFGSIDQYGKLDAKSEYDYYQNVIKHDNIFISIIGDVEDQNILNIFEKFALKSRKTKYAVKPLEIFNLNSHYDIATYNAQSTQSCLNLGYRLPIFYDSPLFLPAVLFNAVFGGTPQSKLFKNVREKNSLAYYANSIYNSINGFIMVNTGIDRSHKDKVINIINQQLNAIASGQIDDVSLNNIKAGMINAKMAILDSPRQSMEQSFVNIILKRQISFDEWVQQINAVSIEQITEVAKQVKLNSIFFLDGQG